MRLSYPDIFTSAGTGEDAEISACGLSNAYMRFLFAVQSGFFSWHDDGEKVQLSDTELALLDMGRDAFARLYKAGGCSMHVFTGTLPGDLDIDTASETAVSMNALYIVPDYVQLSGNGVLLTLAEGQYSLSYMFRMDRNFSPGSGWLHRFRQRNVSAVTQRIGEFSYHGIDETFSGIWYFRNPAPMYLTWEHFSGTTARVRSNSVYTRFEVVKYG